MGGDFIAFDEKVNNLEVLMNSTLGWTNSNGLHSAIVILEVLQKKFWNIKQTYRSAKGSLDLLHRDNDPM